MLRKPLSKKISLLLGLGAIVGLMGLYTLISYWQHQINPADSTIPTWTQLGDGVRKIIEINPRDNQRWIILDSHATAMRLGMGLVFGILGAVVLGLLMGCFDVWEALLVPPMSLLAKVPPTAALAVFFVMVGTGDNMFVTMIAFGILPSLSQSVYLSVREIPEEMLFKAYTLGATRTELIWDIIFQMILPKILDAVRLQIGPAMVYLIAAEMVVGDVGFGYRIRLQSRLMNMNVVYPYLALLAGFGFAMDYSLRKLQQAGFVWYVRKN